MASSDRRRATASERDDTYRNDQRADTDDACDLSRPTRSVILGNRCANTVCVYAYSVDAVPATIVRTARLTSGLSIRALAALAGVAATTITRIENGKIDPTIGTLRNILVAAGRALWIDAPRAAQVHLADLTHAWSRRSGDDHPEWTAFRAAIDHLALHPDETNDAISRVPARSGSAVIDALLAGIADKLADDHHLARPDWTRSATALADETFLMPATPRQQTAIRKATPQQLAARNLLVDASTLWRDRTNIDV
jgi:transcriptional regulator with XRE-family HTH domain